MFLWLFDTSGYIVGPVIWLTGLIALTLCFRASWWAPSWSAGRTALKASLLPLTAGICGALAGIALFGAPNADWHALGKVCLAGLVVTAIPLLWSLILLRVRRRTHGLNRA